MKKLLIAIAAVATATAVHAAAYSWSGTISAYDWDNDIAGAGTVEFFINSTSVGTATFDANGDAAFGAYGIDAGDSVKIIATITNFSDGSGTMEWSKDVTSTFIDSFPSPDDALANLADTANAVFNAGGSGAGLDLTSSVAANGFSPAGAPVPEPTSGLMLLLGMAGLALKRKRA